MPYNILMCVHIYYSPLTPRPKFQEVETDRLSHLPKATQLVRGRAPEQPGPQTTPSTFTLGFSLCLV